MEALSALQQQNGEKIQIIVRNFKKDSQDRKTKAYFEERLQRLDEAWLQFESTDTQIRALPNLDMKHPYFAKDYYNEIASMVENYRTIFAENIKQLEEGKNSSDSDTSQRPMPKNRGVISQTSVAAADSELTKLIRRQNCVIESLRRLLNEVSANDTKIQPRQYYEVKLNSVKQLWTQIESHNLSVWELCDNPAEGGYDISRYLQLEEQVQDTIINLSSHLDNMSATIPSGQTHIDSSLKLPKITIPKFDGDYSKWRQFSDLFIQMIHNQPMANCQKLWYLKANVTGEAEKLLRHLSLSNENYLSAWKMLQDRYENKRLLVAVLVNKLLSQSSLPSDGLSYNSIKSLHDVTRECLLGLENLGISTINWDPLLLHLLVKKLDRHTHTLYEQSLENPKELQTLEHFLTFLENRFQALEALGPKTKGLEEHTRRQPTRSLASIVTLCTVCKGHHQLYSCKGFLNMKPIERLNHLRKHSLCINCMKPGHNYNKCTMRGCTLCNKKHNSLTHIEEVKKQEKTSPETSKVSGKPEQATVQGFSTQPISLATHANHVRQGYVLLSTAVVRIVDNTGRTIECRALLDSGSQINVVTEKIIKRLGIPTTTDSMQIEGIGRGKQDSYKRVTFQLQSRITGFSERLEAHVLKKIISPQPAQLLDTSTWCIPKNIKLADPTFNQPGPIDLLLGAEFYHELLTIGQIKLAEGLPRLQNTVFGWIVTGKVDNKPLYTASCGVLTEDNDINQILEKFWKIEESERLQPVLTPAEKKCELLFSQTTKRNKEGRFVVRLPFSNDPIQLGESKDIALRRFYALERRLSRDHELKKQYQDFMEEYIKLDHMKEVNIENIEKPYCFLPHHSVLKPDSSSTKLRVVFDASAKTSNNISLNDILHAGPVVQDELLAILLRFRMHRFVYTADIQKMYRQILVHEDDRKYQLIMWRNDPNEQVRYYKLCTVTYGTTSAPYLATKCLQKLAQDRSIKYPLGAHVLQQDFYVDDVMTGADSLITATETQAQLVSILHEAGFKLRKWCSNHPNLLRHIPLEDQEIQLDFSTALEQQVKTLGMIWQPKSDKFCVKTNWNNTRKITKRTIASDIARLFDPLGLFAPVIVSAKILLQQLWQLKLDWDASVPMDIHTKWNEFRESLKTLHNIQIPRHVFAHDTPVSKQIHTFADASERAYGAAVYIRSMLRTGVIVVRLLCAKSRVAPTKKVTLPRLELCAAKLAAELTSKVKSDLKQENIETYFWTDSQIVLAWINSQSCSYHTFVANRIACIQELSIPQQWRHVNSRDNPADALSRGVTPERIATHHLWFYGPQFLHGNETIWPPAYRKERECDLERKKTAMVTTTLKQVTEPGRWIEEINHGNSFRRLQRILTYVFRFIQGLKTTSRPLSAQRPPTTQELDDALRIIVKNMQQTEFKEEISLLKQHKEISANSALSGLAPFLDENGILRVGGRLRSSLLPFDAKHQMLLPYKHPFTRLLLNDIHKENLHLGPLALLAQVRQRFWPINGKTLARSVVHHCVRCARARPKLLSQIMGNLPSSRVQPARPFVNSGVDFCGPMWVHYRVRGKRPQKCYIAVFCCFATKAVHLELVSDLSTDAFIGALKRFMGRRGRCKNLYCDNATNFIGARNKLEELNDAIYSHKSQELIQSACSHKGVDFHFIPPRSPHFGGLWEAAVKSAKHLLQRSINSASLTYEEMETLIIEIEAILNSRPITPMSSDPNDLNALTPGHLLIGEPLTANIDPHARDVKTSLIARWKMVSHIKGEFWRRWTLEYLNELQHRSKWKRQSENLEQGTMVILKEDNVPVLKWPLGRVIQTYKGNDGKVRVADIRTSSGILKRPIHKLAPLPCETEGTQGSISSDIEEQEEAATNIPTKSKRSDGHMSETSTTPRKRAKSMYGSSLVTLFLACILLPVIKTSPVELKQFEPQPGIHFDNMGKLNLISSEWELVIYYDLVPYWTEFAMLEKGISAAKHLCDQIRQKASCKPLTKQFQYTIDEIAKENELLPQQRITERQKRGALNVVGNIANSLFGLLDSEYAEQMSRTIDNIRDNEEHLVVLLKNQTSVIDSTLNIIKADQAALERKFQSLDTQIAQLTNRIHDTGEDAYQFKIFQLFSSLVLQMIMVSSNLQKVQATIVNVMTDAYHGKINPLLLSPHQLKKEVATIKNHLPTSYRLPVKQDNILGLYALMTTRSRITNNHIIFQLKLPLVTLEQYDLFKLVPIPALINNSFIAIEPHSTLLAINPHRDYCYSLTEQEVLSCSSPHNGNYLCHQSHPIHHKKSNMCACEMNLFNHIPVTSECKFKEVENNPVWVQLVNHNNWIYAVKSKTPTNVVCGTEAFPIILEGAGLLKIKSDCVIKQDLITIQGHHIYPSSSRVSYTKLDAQFNFTLQKASNALMQENSSYNSHINELVQLKKQLVSTKFIELPRKIKTDTIHNLSIGYLNLLLIGIITTSLLWTCKGRLRQFCRSSKTACHPPPESSNNSPQDQPENFTVYV